MELEKIKDEIHRLSISQQLLLAQEIWDSIAQYNGNVPMAEWQKDKLDKRYAQFKKGKFSVHAWKEVHDSLRKKSI